MNIQEQSRLIIESDKSKNEKVSELVSLVMNIPYKRIGSLDPQDMLVQGMGSCTPKHVFLAQCFSQLDVPVKFLVVPFYYKNLHIDYPSGYDEVIQAMPISYHVALKAKINNTWIIIDVTWDPKLKRFPLNNNWDGKSDMELAITPEEIFEIESDPRTFEKNINKKYSDEEKTCRKEFYEFFDTILLIRR